MIVHLMNNIVFTPLYPSSTRGSSPNIIPMDVDNVEGLIYELGISEKDLITSCSINKKSCRWSKILTPDGLCYAFNLIAPDEMFYRNM